MEKNKDAHDFPFLETHITRVLYVPQQLRILQTVSTAAAGTAPDAPTSLSLESCVVLCLLMTSS